MSSASGSTAAPIATADTELAGLLGRIRDAVPAARSAINLVPSENRMSPAAHALLATDYSNRYHFNDTLDAGRWEFRGGQAAAELENAGREAFSRLALAEYVNLRPLSGLSAMLIALTALAGPPGHTVVSIAVDSGGHYATGPLITRLGHQWELVDCEHGNIDLDRLERILTGGPVGLVYLDLQNSRHVLDVSAVAKLLSRYPATRLHVDISHTLGLVLGGAHPNPLDQGAISAGGSLHKSFPGPHHGALFTRDPGTAARLRDAQFICVSSHHYGHTLAAAVTALEFERYGSHYARTVLDNATALATALSGHGFDVAGAGAGFTETHQVWVRLDEVEKVSDALAQCGIRVNIQSDLPGCPGPMWRLGVAEPTVLGADRQDMRELADILATVRDGHLDHARPAARALQQRIGARPWWSRHTWTEGALS